MKQITIDYELYEKEISESYTNGIHAGVSDVMKFLESGKSLEEFLNCEDYKYLTDPRSHWNRIAVSSGRSLRRGEK